MTCEQRRVEKYVQSGSKQEEEKKNCSRCKGPRSSGPRRKLNDKLWTLCYAMELLSQAFARGPNTKLSQTMSSDVPIRLFPGPPSLFCILQISFFILSVYIHTCTPTYMLQIFPGHIQSRNSEFLHNQGTSYFLTQVLHPSAFAFQDTNFIQFLLWWPLYK